MEFLVLGALEARQSGVPVDVRGMRQQRLLALLLLNVGRVVSMDFLVDELWEDPPSSARPQVHNAIRDLRRVLAAGEHRLVTADVGYRLAAPEDAVDANRFARKVREARAAERDGRTAEAIRLLQSAVDLWRGEAFAGIHCPAVTSAAVKLNEQRLTAVEDLMALRLKVGETSSLVGELTALLAEYPLRDSLRRSLMTALCRGGRQADALAVYDEGRRFLAAELGLEPSPGLRALQAEILADGPGVHGPEPVAAAPELPYQARESAGRPNCLPHDLADFTGRGAECALLLEAVEHRAPGAPLMLAVDGMGGVGKTTLAVRIAHELTDRFPDGQFFVGLDGFDESRPPVPPLRALAALLRADGLRPEEVPATLEERSALWRSRLAGRRCLLVLDDAADSAQVRPLLPGAGETLVLVTSRRKLGALDGSVALPLDVLPPADAVELLARVAGRARVAREPGAAAEAAALCGHLPLAVRIAATKLRDRPAWTVAELAARLADPVRRAHCLRTPDRDLMALLRASYQYLDRSQRSFSRLMSRQGEESFDAQRAAAVTGLSPDEAEGLLDVLFEHNLVRQEASALFSFHCLLRDCASALAEPPPVVFPEAVELVGRLLVPAAV
ncbi:MULTISPECIES: AfsR/SARP family transcriptional regulator [Kitasatospora]|uniref:Putative AfsR family transcriptional regulator n=1 Tax=Kitasatospora setae (strain ATCC 33774 / DSM 43861 / JCM 3304 / KCC A-0304 / NBRC 14216 / KM-6054) TaxID=452652 RepID=E4MZU8_KITSK|nr:MULTISPECIES: AfsR/SARP family transcriptional regulator [Kitasatospora]BAJ30032.1 putative AfsR family transcriptional regulator [Kitasatospora setae KM-6054]